MFGARDVFWAVVICCVATLFVQCRPELEARRFIEREARAGFQEAYAGYRMHDGEMIAEAVVHADDTAPRVTFHSIEVAATRVAWNGRRAELVVRHKIELDGNDASRDIHVRLEKRNGKWVYTLFHVRGAGDMDEPNGGNPFARALRAS